MNKNSLLPKLVAYSDIGLSLEEILDLSKDIDWENAKIGGTVVDNNPSIDTTIRNASTKNLLSYSLQITNAIADQLSDYSAEHDLEDLQPQLYSLVRYTEGQFFSEHSDSGELMPRRLSMVLYLNDNYDGGELEFTKFNKTVKPKLGTLLFFPSTDEYSHAAQKVVSGTKFVLVGFWK